MGNIPVNSQMRTALLQVGQIKGIPVKMEKYFKLTYQTKKGMKQIGFGIFGVCKPLNEIPGVLLPVQTANQIELRGGAGKSGGFNIKEKQIFWRANLF